MGTSSGRVVMLVVGLVVGAGAAGVPMYMKATSTQTQLSTTQQKLAASTQQLDATKQQLGTAAQQLTAATQQVAQLQQQQSDLASQRDELEQQQSNLQAQAAQLAKPDLPVQVSVHAALFGTGKQLEIHNLTANPLPITATFGRAGFPSVTKELVVPARFQTLIGTQQGWSFLPGDTVSLSNPRYRPKNGRIR